MSAELPLVSAIMARLADPKIHLAAYGGIVFPLSMIVEAPIIMLLSASTALSRDHRSYELLRRFMLWTGAGLTALHLLVALTPLYGFVVGNLIHAPEEIRGPARIGLIIMTPWTFSIAYRRLHQGVLIRFGRSHSVGIGTVVRLSGNVIVLAIGYAIHSIPGIVVGATAVAFGVVSEAVFIGLAARPVVANQLRAAPALARALTLREFYTFYIPLAMTPLLMLLSGPIGSAAVSRMPRALDSLAVWPVISGLGFAFRSIGIAFNEVVVALLDRPGANAALRRFALMLGATTSLLLLLIAATPLAGLYFGRISALPAPLAELGRRGILIILLMPAQAVLQSWFQGQILHSRKTRGITEAVGVYLAVNTVVLLAGIHYGGVTGIYVALAGLVAGAVAQVAWLAFRSRAAQAATSTHAVS
jgi:hypothetical protein